MNRLTAEQTRLFSTDLQAIDRRPQAWSTVPRNLLEWATPGDVAEWVTQAIESLRWSNPAIQEYLSQHPDYRPKVLIAVLAYGYCSGVYSSQELFDCTAVDSTFVGLCAGCRPFPAELRKFRRANRILLEEVLVSIYRKALAARYDTAAIRTDFETAIKRRATEHLDIARHFDRLDD